MEDLLRENKGVADMATRAIANRVSELNPQVMVSRKGADGTLTDEVLDDHPAKALLDRPHPDFTKQQLLRLTTQWVVTVGDGYWLKITNGFGVPSMLQPIPPHMVEPVLRKARVTHYKVRDGMGNEHLYRREELIRFWFPDPETVYTGEGYLGPNAVVADSERFAGMHLRNKYQNDATPPVLLKSLPDAVMPGEPVFDRWQADYKAKYHSLVGTKRGLPSMLPPGWEPVFAALQSGADIAPLLEFWQANQLMNFGVPASVLGRVVSGDRSSAETNQYVFDRFTVLPVASMVAQALTHQMAGDFDTKIWINFEEFVSEDKDFELKRENQDVTLKIKSIQQVLEARGEDPEEASWGEFPVGSFGDVPYTGEERDNLLGGDDPNALFEPDPEDEEEEPRKRPANLARVRAHFDPESEWQRVLARERKWRPRFERTLRGIFEAQRKSVLVKLHAMKLPDRSRAPVDPDQLFDPEAWERMFAVRLEPTRKLAYVEAAIEALEGVGSDAKFLFNPVVVKILRKMGADLVTATGTTTRKRLAKALAQGAADGEGVGSLVKRINEVFGTRRVNAATIARTELLKATQHAQIEGFTQSGVVEWKRWNDNRDADVRDSHIETAILPVRLHDEFVLPSGVRAQHPGDIQLPVGEVANCRCFVTPEFEDPTGISA